MKHASLASRKVGTALHRLPVSPLPFPHRGMPRLSSKEKVLTFIHQANILQHLASCS